MKTLLKHWPIALILAAIGMAAVGCALFSGTQVPTATEHAFYDVQTNYITVPVTVLQTNMVQATNTTVVLATNTVGQIVTATNAVIVPQYVIVPVTNYIQQPVYALTPNATTVATANSVAVIGNSVVPGAGTLAGAAMTALVGLWGWLRSYKQGTQQASAAGALSQEIETMLEFINTLPNGTSYTTAITSWLQSHQVQTGTVSTVLSILENQVSNPAAKAAVADIQQTLTTLATPLVPTPAIPTVPPKT